MSEMSDVVTLFSRHVEKRLAWMDLDCKAVSEIAKCAAGFFEAREVSVLGDIRYAVEDRPGVMMQAELVERVQALAAMEKRAEWHGPTTKPLSDDPVLLLTGEGEYLVCRFDKGAGRWKYRGKTLSEFAGVVKWRYVDL